MLPQEPPQMLPKTTAQTLPRRLRQKLLPALLPPSFALMSDQPIPRRRESNLLSASEGMNPECIYISGSNTPEHTEDLSTAGANAYANAGADAGANTDAPEGLPSPAFQERGMELIRTWRLFTCREINACEIRSPAGHSSHTELSHRLRFHRRLFSRMPMSLLLIGVTQYRRFIVNHFLANLWNSCRSHAAM